jgi:hypothetical protein
MKLGKVYLAEVLIGRTHNIINDNYSNTSNKQRPHMYPVRISKAVKYMYEYLRTVIGTVVFELVQGFSNFVIPVPPKIINKITLLMTPTPALPVSEYCSSAHC